MTTEASTEASVSGQMIIEQYLEGKVDATITYGKLCHAVDLLPRWQPAAAVEFLTQFIEIGHLLDHRCKKLVQQFVRLEWHALPIAMRESYVKMLRHIAIHHVCFTEMIVKCFIDHLQAKVQPIVNNANVTDENKPNQVEYELKVTSIEQNQIFELSHQSLTFLFENFPIFFQNFFKLVRRCYPHHSVSKLRYVSFVDNLLCICNYAPTCCGEIFSILINEMTQLDALIAKNEDANASTKNDNALNGLSVFFMDEDVALKGDQAVQNTERMEKLDLCMTSLFVYIAKICGENIAASIESGVREIGFTCSKNKLFEEMLGAFEEHLLMAHNLRYVPFLWFYMCSLDNSYRNRFIKWLWNFVTHLSKTPNDWKKSHGAACYIGSLLSRASFVNLSEALEWMEIFLRWCTNYVNELVDRSEVTAVGVFRHGTFYAVFQAFLLTFCFRYCELVQANELDSIRKWAIGHIIHSKLEPLLYISRPVALCFATISRSLQLIYCNHIVSVVNDEKMPFEPFFPFDDYALENSSVFVGSLIRQFSPLREDADVLKSELKYQTLAEEAPMECGTGEQSVGAWQFLEDASRDKAELLSDGEASPQKNLGEFLTCYSTSPGLKQFKMGWSRENQGRI